MCIQKVVPFVHNVRTYVSTTNVMRFYLLYRTLIKYYYISANGNVMHTYKRVSAFNIKTKNLNTPDKIKTEKLFSTS